MDALILQKHWDSAAHSSFEKSHKSGLSRTRTCISCELHPFFDPAQTSR